MRGNNHTSVARALRGPLTLITVGALFALNNFTPYGFGRTWPVILIVFGLLTLVDRGTSPAQAPQPNSPPYAYPPQSGGQWQPPYTPPPPAPQPAGTARGGFGASAPPRPSEPGPTPDSGGAQ